MTIDAHRPARFRRFPLALAFAAILSLALGAQVQAKECGELEDLHPGEPVNGVSSDLACPAGPGFTVEIPAGAARLSISSSGGTGNASLLVKFGSAPTPTDFDYASDGPGNLENITIDNPHAGTWYIQVRPHEPFTGVTLVADFSAPETEVHDGQPEPDLGDDHQDDVQYFTINIPPGTASVSIATSGGTGNADLLVRFGALPTAVVFDAASRGKTNT